MNIGKRIEQRLADLKWERKNLLEALPDLSPQALSNLIVRDSKRSEWDVQIAKALGVSVTWLVYGDDALYPVSQPASRLEANSQPAIVYDFQSAATRAVLDIMANLDDQRQNEVVAFAEERLTLQRVNQNSTQRARQ